MADQKSEQGTLSGQLFIYFIEVHDKNKNFKLDLSNNSGIKSSETELLEEKEFPYETQFNYIYKIHRIKVLKEKPEFEISVQFKEEGQNENIYERKITNDEILDNTTHAFFYNFQPTDNNKNNCFSKNSSNEYPLNYFEQFKTYINILKEKYKIDRKSKECQDCIEYAMKILDTEEYEFNFYLAVFAECFDTKNIQQLLKLFKTDKKLTQISDFNIKDLKYFEDIINRVTQDPNLVLEQISENGRHLAKTTLYAIILIFDLKFQNEKLKSIKLNDELLNLIFSQYLHFIKFFDLDDIKEILSLTDDCYTFLFILSNIIYFLYDKFNEERKNKKKNEKDLIFQIDNYVVLKEEEKKLDKILVLIGSLVEFQKSKKFQFISFSLPFFQTITELINENNIEQLFSLQKILNTLKSIETSARYNKIDIDKKIDKIINKSIDNQNIGFFKNKFKALMNYLQKNDKYLDEFAIEMIRNNEKNEEFINYRREKKKKHDKDFIKKACSVVTSLNQFDLLLEILCKGMENKEFLQNALISIQEMFFNIYIQYTNEQLMKYLDIISELIYRSDRCLSEENFWNFLDNLERILNKDFITNLYINVLNKNKTLKNRIKIHNYLEKLEPKYIAILIKDLNENSIDLINRKLTKYVIKEEEFFNLKDSTSIEILTSLIDYGIFPQKDSSNPFLKETYNRIESIRNRIKNYEFTYNTLSSFLEKENNKKFSERISLLYIIDNKEMINDFLKDKSNINKSFINIQESLENKYNEIKKYYDLLCLMRDYLSIFGINQCQKELVEIIKMIFHFQESKVNNIDIEFTKKIENYEKIYGKNARERNKYIESFIFLKIREKEAELYKDDEKIIEKCFLKFEQTKEIFNKDAFDCINEEVLSIYLDVYRKISENEMEQELKRVMNILNIEIPDNLTEDIIKSLNLLSLKDKVIEVTEAVKILIEQTEAIQREFIGTINNIIEFKENICHLDFLKMSIEILEALGIDVRNEESCFINILLRLREKPDVIKFLIKINIEECGLLYDTLDNNEFLKISDIIALEKCVEYMNSLGNIDEIKQMKDYELFEKAKSSNLINKNLEIYFSNFISHYDDIKEIIKEKFDKSEASRQKIQYICQNSNFCLSSFELNYFDGKYTIRDVEKKNDPIFKNINLNELQELRDRAILTINPLGETKENIIFINMVSEILKLSNLINEIYNYGFTETATLRISMKKNKYNFEITSPENYIDESENVEKIISILKKIINNLKLSYKNGYKKYKYIRYIYGRQFNIIYNYLFNIETDNIIPFLKFITNNELKNNKINYKWKEDIKDNFENVIINCNDFIKKVIKDNNLSLKKIYSKTLIKKKQKLENEEYKGFYVYSCTKVEKEIIQLYIYLTENIPIAQNILLCNKRTSNEEITAFLNRAIYCKYNSCFVIGGIESLKFNQKNYFIEILNQLLCDVNGTFKSCLIIFSSEKSSDIYKSLDSIKYKKTFLSSIEKDLEKIKIDKLDSITIITSDRAGIGKSTKIENEIKKKGKKYIYFPLGGVFTRNDIVLRLKELKIVKNAAIHLDLYDTDCTDLMLEFLFWILIAKLYKANEYIFYLLEDTEIYLEIPNGFINFLSKFPILELFPQKPENKLSINKLEPLIVDSKVQIVSNYLKLNNEKKIDNRDLYISGITLELISDSNPTLYKAQDLSQEECNKLIIEEIKKNNKDNKFINYYQIRSFIDILYDEFLKFNNNIHLSANNYLFNKHLRTYIINGFIKLSNYFTQGAFTKLINEQNIAHKMLFGKYDENEDNRNGINNLATDKHSVISFDKIEYPLLFFHEGDNSLNFSYITNKDKNDSEYRELLTLINSQSTMKKIDSFPNYNDNNYDFLQDLKNILDIKNPLKIKDKTKDDKSKGRKSLEEIANNYAFDKDNFVKMILILLRLRANIPVIMMGETGCGKTALIKKFSELKNDGDSKKLKILNIHAGTTDNDIINFIKNIEPEAMELEEEEEKNRKKREQQNMIYEKKKIWVFLDEINTCKSMGLISELMCKHTYHGNKICSNIVFIGACNPYREAKKKLERVGLEINQAYNNFDQLNEKQKINLKKMSTSSNSKLVYSVNPLPHSLLNFVYDFASLDEEIEKRYISKIIEPSINNVLNQCKEDYRKKDDIKDLTIKMIFEAQKFIRDNYDKSSVSLREIKRYNVFYEFFFGYLKDKKEKLDDYFNNESQEKDLYEKWNEYDLQINAINLSIYICYYLRISNKKLREKLEEKLNEILNNMKFLDLPLLEMKFISDNVNIPKGIAKNKALSENIFALFCAINTRIPIFIVGKPGCSKSLSIQLIVKSMKGSSFKNEFFKKYFSKLVVFSYQGSLSSTSEGVETIFKKANRAMEEFISKKKDNISMIFFDEMGLAEHSPNNPLKVIHSQLEIDPDVEGKPKAAFVGISNWVLDAAKMNRGLHISIPELDEEDIIITSKTIAESYNKELVSKFSSFFENLGKTYYEYKLYLKQKHHLDGKEDFHGNRDFFHFIKYASKKISDNINTNIENDLPLIGLNSINRNFAGLKFEQNNNDSVEIAKNIYNKYYPNITKKYDSIKCIRENIEEDNSRYLLLISNSLESCYLLSSNLEHDNYNFIIGSHFIEDFNDEEYQLKVIKKIQIYMEAGKTIILKDLESVYPALYDLFNQNFTIMNGKNYARISIGTSFNIYSQVNKNFKCIVNVDMNSINKQEPPFLNRFEKHILKYDNLLDQKLLNISNKIFDIFNKIIDSKKEYILDNYDFKKILINIELEEIKGMVYKASKNIKNENKENKIIEEVLSKIALTLPQDVIFQIKYNKNIMHRELITKYYLEGEHSNLEKFLKAMNKSKNVIYTFSKILDKINNINKIENKNLNLKINSLDNIKIIKIGGIKSEKEYEKNIDEFFSEDKYKICIIHFSPEESNLINYTKFFLENKEKEYKNNQKIFILIIHILRIFNNELDKLKNNEKEYQEFLNKKTLKERISNLSDYYQIFIDNLNGDKNACLKEVFDLEKNKIFDIFLSTNKNPDENINTLLNYFKYNILYSFGELNKENYYNQLIKYIKENQQIRTQINNYIRSHLLGYKGSTEKTYDNGEKKGIQIEIHMKDTDLIDVLKSDLSNLYNSYVGQTIFKLAKNSFFSSLLTINEEVKLNKNNNEYAENFDNLKKIISKISEIFLENISKEEVKITEKPNSNIVNVILGAKIPGIKTSIENIVQKISENVTKFRINEFNLRNRKDISDDNIENNYWKELKRYCNFTVREIKKDSYISKIIEALSEKELELFYDILINDYCILFINNNLYLNYKSSKKNKQINIDSIRKMLSLLIKLKNDKIGNQIKEEGEEDIKNKLREVANTINWLECYKNEIIIILKAFGILGIKMENDLYDCIKDNIYNIKKIENNNSERNLGYTSIVNEEIFLGTESLIKILISNDKLFNNINDGSKLVELINYYREIVQDFSRLQSNLMIYSKEMLSMEEIVEIFNLYYKNNKKKDNYIEIIKYFENETESINRNDSKNLIANFDELFQLLLKNIGKDKNFPKIINIIFLNEFKKIEDSEFRISILNKLIKENEYIFYSSYLIEFIFGEYIKHDDKNFKENINNIKNCNLIDFFNEHLENEILGEILMNCFEFHINLYFKAIEKKNNFINFLIKKVEKEEDNEFRTIIIFEESIDLLNNTNEDNFSICTLYLISFVKMYLNKVVLYYAEQISIEDIINKINLINNNNEMRILIKFYFYKLLYNHFSNYEEFNNKKILGKIKHSDNFKFIIKRYENGNENNDERGHFNLPFSSF